ncbi:2'-deoxynucleoside 5'-phosphate N-hydrolase 1-like [Mya arenaria]|uniref:2'-deoxynucleoside 5'-phosphate N-hydrolase 1-like n=1 Tax=Mya arenaria TaxID=6604 RepID=UPI0022E310F1|nr:2'-deoxynucleoside 5'-phosphate N-hydrolase 1-like [Mya arenaria]
MKIYFCGSITSGRQDVDIYARLIEELRKYGRILTEHVGIKDAAKMPTWSNKEVLQKSLQWLRECDVLVAEVTQPSLGVGYEIGRAAELGKTILCLYRPSPDRKLTDMLTGGHDGKKFTVKYYEEKDISTFFKDFFSQSLVKENNDAS